MNIKILRYGHRLIRDKRITTHCSLVARTFGADEIIIYGDEDEKLKENIEDVEDKWGGSFKLSFGKNWRKDCKKLAKEGYKIVHLTMYGLPVDEAAKEIRKHKKIAVFIGSQKVPPEVYSLADYNVAVANQPHSEVSSLAILLDRIFQGKELKKSFKGGKISLAPSAEGKNILRN